MSEHHLSSKSMSFCIVFLNVLCAAMSIGWIYRSPVCGYICPASGNSKISLVYRCRSSYSPTVSFSFVYSCFRDLSSTYVLINCKFLSVYPYSSIFFLWYCLKGFFRVYEERHHNFFRIKFVPYVTYCTSDCSWNTYLS